MISEESLQNNYTLSRGGASLHVTGVSCSEFFGNFIIGEVGIGSNIFAAIIIPS